MSQTSPVTATVTGSWSNDQELIALCMDMLGDVPGETLDQRVEKLVSYHLELQLMYSELRGHAQCQQEPRWTEDGLALAFFDYSACSERRCGWTEPGDCDCRNAARKAVHWIKHVLPRSFPLASSDTSTDCEGK